MRIPELAATLVMLTLASSTVVTATKPESQSDRPNIVLVLIDDLGWNGTASYGNKLVKTPHIDKLAAEGAQFNAAYAMAQCSPTRFAFMTGQYAARTNHTAVIMEKHCMPYARMIQPESNRSMDKNLFNVGRMLKQAGYHVGQVGKWHVDLGEMGPQRKVLGRDYIAQWGWEEMKSSPDFKLEDDAKGVMKMTNAALHYLDTHRDQPAFAYLAHHTVHTRVEAPERLVQKYIDKGFARALSKQPKISERHCADFLAMIDYVDESIGYLMEGIEELQLERETIVIFMSDNGGLERLWDMAPLRRGKGSEYEGGIRVPLIVHWPSKVAAGQVIDKPVHIIDLYPTFMEIAGGDAGSHHLDGVSILPLMDGRGGFDRAAIYMHTPLYIPHYNKTPSSLIRTDDYKLIYFHGDYLHENDYKTVIPGERYELYRINEDISEQQNLTDAMPEKTAELKAKLHAWLEETGAQMPVINPDFDPDGWQFKTSSRLDYQGNVILRDVSEGQKKKK